ncbi:VOC family protein [Nocardia sp. NPDC051052]|uniref:VOC family protein n=1 Tax=Nocardia sp. NPDC051052 TaxID=3364322 RepID=UPI0037B69233
MQINIKARDDSALGQFWADAPGWGVSSEGPGVTNVEPVGLTWPDPAALYIDVVTVPDPETVRYRVHVDLATTSAAHQAELVTHLQDLGATPPTSVRATSHGRSSPTPRATTSASSALGATERDL